MLRVGEKVRYLDEVGEATIIELVDAKTAIVEDEYGLQHPYPISKLVPAERDHEPTRTKPVAPVQAEPKPQPTIRPTASKRNPLPELAILFVSTEPKRPDHGDLDVIFVNA
ncbi:MAG: hypothetical protein EP314_01200, partial [Bacteroidetes bacterium]